MKNIFITVMFIIAFSACSQEGKKNESTVDPYIPTLGSLNGHQCPEWFHERALENNLDKFT